MTRTESCETCRFFHLFKGRPVDGLYEGQWLKAEVIDKNENVNCGCCWPLVSELDPKPDPSHKPWPNNTLHVK